MANRARLCAGGENTPRKKTRAGETETEQGQEEGSGCRSWCPPGLETSFPSSAPQPRWSWWRRREISSVGLPTRHGEG